MGLAAALYLCQDHVRPPRRLAEFIMLQLIRWTSLAAIAALLVLMLGPFQGAEGAVGMTDKPAHALAFAVITAGIFLNAPQWSRLQVAGVAFSIGMGVELIQSLTGRNFEVRDSLADLVGIVVVACLWWGRKWI